MAASYATEHVEPELLKRRLEEVRTGLRGEHPALDCFRVLAAGHVTVDGAERPWTEVSPDELAQAVGTWVRTLFERLETGLRGRFPVARLRALTGAIHEDMDTLGFYRVLGLDGGHDAAPTQERAGTLTGTDGRTA